MINHNADNKNNNTKAKCVLMLLIQLFCTTSNIQEIRYFLYIPTSNDFDNTCLQKSKYSFQIGCPTRGSI